MTDSGSFSDLVERAFSGEGQAFDELYRSLHWYLYNFMGNYHAAEDVAQDTLKKVWQEQHRIHHPERAKSWFFQIAHHAAVDYLRKYQKPLMRWEEPGLQEKAQESSLVHSLFYVTKLEELPEPYAERRELQLLVRQTLMSIAELPRSCLILKFVYNLRLKEIALLHQRDERTVLRYIKEGREAFQQAYGNLTNQHHILERSSGR